MSEERKGLSRREFLRVSAAGAGAGALALSSPDGALAARKGSNRWVMVIDVRRCIGCHACTVACKTENRVPLGVWRTHIRTSEKGSYPNVKRLFFPWLCNHLGYCAEATQSGGLGSFYKREDGIVLFDHNKLKGQPASKIREEAELVTRACPLEAIHINPQTGLPEKCTFCFHRVKEGLVPSCVQTCIGRARVFGDLSDPKSVVSKLIATNPTTQLGPEPIGSVYYIGLDDSQVKSIKGYRQIDPTEFDRGILSQYI